MSGFEPLKGKIISKPEYRGTCTCGISFVEKKGATRCLECDRPVEVFCKIVEYESLVSAVQGLIKDLNRFIGNFEDGMYVGQEKFTYSDGLCSAIGAIEHWLADVVDK